MSERSDASADRGLIYQIYLGDDTPEPDPMWVNLPNEVIRGPHRHPLSLYEASAPGSGIPANLERPVVVFDVTHHNTMGDAHIADGERLFLSRRARDVFLGVDQSALECVPVTVRVRNGPSEVEGPEYFLCDFTRFVDALDELRSNVKIIETGNRLVRLLDDKGTFRREIVGAFQLFRLMYSPSIIACTDKVRAAVEAAALTNLRFRRLGEIRGPNAN